MSPHPRIRIICDDPGYLVASFNERRYYWARDLWRRADGTPTGDCLHLAFQRALREHRAKEIR